MCRASYLRYTTKFGGVKIRLKYVESNNKRGSKIEKELIGTLLTVVGLVYDEITTTRTLPKATFILSSFAFYVSIDAQN